MTAAPRPEDDVVHPPLADPYEAPGGLVVETLGSMHALMEMGRHFQNALGNEGYARSQVGRMSERQVYRVLLDGLPLSCGEIVPEGDGVVHVWDRAHQNRPGSPATLQAVESFVAAVNAGEVETNYAVEDGRFVEKAPAPRP